MFPIPQLAVIMASTYNQQIHVVTNVSLRKNFDLLLPCTDSSLWYHWWRSELSIWAQFVIRFRTILPQFVIRFGRISPRFEGPKSHRLTLRLWPTDLSKRFRHDSGYYKLQPSCIKINLARYRIHCISITISSTIMVSLFPRQFFRAK